MNMRREEMSRIVSDVKNRIKSDVCNQLNNFFRTHGVSVEDFSSFTGIHRDEVRRVLGGDANISLDTFVKIMVATGNAVEIKSIAPKRRSVNGGMPRPHRPMPFPTMGEMPPFDPTRGMRIPMGGMREDNRPRPWENNPEMNENEVRPQMDEMGDLNDVRGDHNLHSLSREELVDMVVDMGLENEIDLRRATRSALINFLTAHPFSGAPVREELPTSERIVESRPHAEGEGDMARLMEKIHRLMTTNPQLKENITRLFGE
jgi:plasmid maintenance system antidote protein VapI